MNKKQILASLNNIANNLDKNGLYEEANTLTNIMQKVAQMPAPTAPVQPTGFFQNIGNAFSNIGSSIGQELPTLGQAYSNVMKYPAQFALSTLGMNATQPGINAFNIYRQDRVYRRKQQDRYYVQTEQKKIIDTAINEIKNNSNLTFAQAKQQTINKAKIHPNFQQINNFCISTFKMQFPDIIALNFDNYVVKAFPQKTALGPNQDTTNIEKVKSNVWVPPIEKY